MSLVYAAALLGSGACIGLLDARFRLAFARTPIRTGVLLAVGVAFFLAWDLVGIATGVFRHLDSRWATGILVAPELPVEELLFVAFLCYLTLVLLGGARRLAERRATR
ncbi:lycopene cyclase domain-containing protein [Microbacterium resistens]|uniref:lycopene cyclase domain-containing protein n=1 Tax=Microbacterium resistens TaxID=156977 RepID=UPI001C5777E2|nr:lycopene cyclase domain-containing protein [Microbacterium resistens]MBW1639786.1 lycopene cyclase domain-containing protein [Microbacterium resistens]